MQDHVWQSFGLCFELRPIPPHDVAAVETVPSIAPRCPTGADAGTDHDADASAD